MPRKPSTTDGKPPSNSTSGSKISRAQRGAISEMKIAVPIPNGTVTNFAPSMTISEPLMNGKVP